ncbi:MAG: uroporphyrinogen-III synthase [Flavobacteriaceae bacterium]|nr:uroporphyrinogen-III synthase [Flavobacteriaceae bacterium]
MKTVLSTKMLSLSQKELFLNSGLGLVEYDALKIELLDVKIPLDHSNYIFTSKNAVNAFLKQTDGLDRSGFNAFCVGGKTKALLEDNGLKVMAMHEYASELAKHIVESHKSERFLFLCGNRRRDVIPQALTNNEIGFEEMEVYRTELHPKIFKRDFDGILFFSPSGIQSYLLENTIGSSTLFCIGDTTAAEAKKHSNHIILANKPTVENVLVQAINHYRDA